MFVKNETINLEDVMLVKVRKSINKGKDRIRFSNCGDEFNLADMNSFKWITFEFAANVSEDQKRKVIETWKHKIVIV